MKQVVLVRTDLKMPKGKLSTQVAHACVEAVLNSSSKNIEKWRDTGMKKIVLKVKSKEELLDYKIKADKIGLVNSLIKDAGKTFFKGPTITCLGIGPDREELIDLLTKDLGML